MVSVLERGLELPGEAWRGLERELARGLGREKKGEGPKSPVERSTSLVGGSGSSWRDLERPGEGARFWSMIKGGDGLMSPVGGSGSSWRGLERELVSGP